MGGLFSTGRRGGTDLGVKKLETLGLCADFSVFLDILFRRDPTLNTTWAVRGRVLDVLVMAGAPGKGFLTFTRRVCAGRG